MGSRGVGEADSLSFGRAAASVSDASESKSDAVARRQARGHGPDQDAQGLPSRRKEVDVSHEAGLSPSWLHRWMRGLQEPGQWKAWSDWMLGTPYDGVLKADGSRHPA